MRFLLLPFLLQASMLFAQEQPPYPPAVSPVPKEVTMEAMEGMSDEPETIPVDANAPQEPLTIAEQMPEFPGGQEAMMAYMVKHMRYPQDCIENEVEGKVYLGFVVDREGLVIEVKVLRGVPACPAMDKEAVRVIQSMPKWSPGHQNGKPVPVRMTVPVVFKLN